MSRRYDYDYEEDINDGIDEMVQREGKSSMIFPTMNHAERLMKLKRYPHLAAELAACAAAALAACCFSRNGWPVVDQGVAFGHGRWFACRRYGR
jgi:hypothetical protein